MLLDTNSGAAARQRKLIVAAVIVVWLGCVSTMAYVAVHFVSKYW